MSGCSVFELSLHGNCLLKRPKAINIVVIQTGPFIRLWAQDVELLLFNVVLPWNMTSMSETKD